MPTNKNNIKNYIQTLAFNLPSETEKTTRLIYDQNKSTEFKHYICDLGFPILEGDKIPESVSEARKKNTEKLKDICVRYGSTYIQMENVGVSQNWTTIINHCKLRNDDVIIGADPDERTMDHGWIDAMSKVLRQDNVGVVSLIMPEQVELMRRWTYTDYNIDGVRAIDVHGATNWALIGFSGKFLRLMGEVPYPKDFPRYGYLESFVRKSLDALRYKCLFLPDYRVYHTDYPKDQGSSKLLREWKNRIIFKANENLVKFGEKQMDLVKFLEYKKRGIL